MILGGFLFLAFTAIGFRLKCTSFRHWLCFLPSLSWLILMAVPFWLWGQKTNDVAEKLQEFGILLIGSLLLVADGMSSFARTTSTGKQIDVSASKIASPWFYFCLSVIIMGLHLWNMEKIPLIEKYFSTMQSPVLLAQLREQSSKLLKVPFFIKYLFSMVSTIFMPIAISLFFVNGKFLWGCVALTLALLYAAMTLAVFPLIILSVSLLLVFFICGKTTNNNQKGKLFIGGLVVLLIARMTWVSIETFSAFAKTRWSSGSVVCAQGASDCSMADKYRILKQNGELGGPEKKLYLYIIYRVLWVPHEVSYYWYKYFPQNNEGYLGLSDYLPSARNESFVHPANKVGRWAYYERFPDQYLKSVYAYSSVDADAYARGGLWGLCIVSIMVFFMRIGLLGCTTSPFGRTLYGLGLCQLSVLPAQASVAAILVAQGFFVILGLAFAERFALDKRFNQNIRLFYSKYEAER